MLKACFASSRFPTVGARYAADPGCNFPAPPGTRQPWALSLGPEDRTAACWPGPAHRVGVEGLQCEFPKSIYTPPPKVVRQLVHFWKQVAPSEGSSSAPLHRVLLANDGCAESLPFLVQTRSPTQQALTKHHPCNDRLQMDVKRVPPLKELAALWGGWTSDQL